MPTKSKALQLVEPSRFLSIATPDSPAKLQAAFRDYGIGQFDLPQLRTPGGGSTMWETETLEGPEASKELEVIVVKVRMGMRKFWADDMDDADTGKAPDCASSDGITGLGTLPGDDLEITTEHACATCPYSQWESANSGKGQACRVFGIALVLMPDTLLPSVLTVPTTSLSSRDPQTPGLKNYLMTLVNSAKVVEGVLTKLTLNPQAQGKNKWSTIVFRYGGDLDAEAAKRVAGLVESMTSVLDAQAKA